MRYADLLATTATVTILAAAGATAVAQNAPATFNGISVRPDTIIPGVGQVMIPYSSIEQPGDVGVRAHTHYRILKTIAPVVPPNMRPAGARPLLSEPETPASLACVYHLVPQTDGCDPNIVSQNASGGSQAIAIVDAFHNQTAEADLKTFSDQFGLPKAKLQVVFCSSTKCGVGTPPPTDQGWAFEIALDIQWAHAMAPKAKIILVEANSNSFNDLLLAEDKAAELVAAAGGGQVSNSWGGSEFSGQTSFDGHFVKRGVVFFASTGDHKGGTTNPDVEYPSTSPNVIGVGGTTIVRNKDHIFKTESAWIDGGGGLSAVYDRPGFQKVIKNLVGNTRGVPDVSWNADPASGAVVFCSAGTCGSQGGFFVVGGTSLAAPAIAAMTNNAGHFRPSGDAQHTALYDGLGGKRFEDTHKGKCGNGPNGAFVHAVTGWDRCTGIGTPKGKKGL
jgi:hypothetical protein